ncbi:hypothetical protein F511_24510 [Dorcoceras hygrometricum]|uniref:Uncharacterized protein n=1 Tax=Dorcoceras hygrometricum TaxID=472368 RepID=A0A2Z7APT6_9LAMI|nr:hypothetical protein F511_24510 [Dorcoceras hygrometricum]
MVVDLIGIYGLKGPYCTLTTTNWFLQALSMIPRGSWGDVARRFTMIRWASPEFVGRRPLPSLQAVAAAAARLRRKIVSGQFDEENPFVQISSVLLVQADEGVSFLVVDRIGDFYRNLPRRIDVIVTTVGARHKCQQAGLTTFIRTIQEAQVVMMRRLPILDPFPRGCVVVVDSSQLTFRGGIARGGLRVQTECYQERVGQNTKEYPVICSVHLPEKEVMAARLSESNLTMVAGKINSIPPYNHFLKRNPLELCIKYPYLPKAAKKNAQHFQVISMQLPKKKVKSRLITISSSDGRWHGNWNCDYTFTLRQLLHQQDLPDDVDKDADVSINLCIQKVIYVKPGCEADLDSLIQETIYIATSIRETCSEACENSEPKLQHIGAQNVASIDKRWHKLLELKSTIS